MLMRRVAWPGSLFLALLGPACALLLLLACFSAVLFRGEQFAYRDAATVYYPLYLRVQQEWDAGRWPLWDPGQNAGVPLLGMPRAAVLYPGKILHALLPYPWAVRFYTVVHVAVAWAGTFALGRSFRLSATAAGLAALSYAFGAPVLFQYCNIIHLVGAAWIPWGFLAVEWLIGQGRLWGLPTLSLVLALPVLGGDLEAAYVTVLCGVAYAMVQAAWDRPEIAQRRGRFWCLLLLVGWVGTTLGVAYAAPRIAAPDWLPPRAIVQGLGWGIPGLAVAWRWRRRGSEARLGPRLAALACASFLGLTLAAAQLVPAGEHAAPTLLESDDLPVQIYGYSVEPYRLLEAVWPDVWGPFGPENRSWIQALPPAGERQLWTPSLYIGGLTLMFSAAGLGFSRMPGDRPAPAWRAWLSLIAIGAVAAGFGRFGGPLWVARWLPGVSAVLGPHDPPQPLDRVDGFLHDGAGSVYGLMVWVLPGFSWFRFPAKLLPFATLALAVLAGLGWERLSAGETRLPRRWSLIGLAVTLAALFLIGTAHGPILTWLTRRLPAATEFGPVDPRAALAATVRSLIHGGLVLGLGLVLCRLARRLPRSAGALALMAMALDLGIANARLLWTLPQAEFETTPRALALIKEDQAEEEPSSQGLFRVDRMGMAAPGGWSRSTAKERLRAAFAWQRDTLDSLSGLPLDLQYTLRQGEMHRDTYELFFRGGMAAPAGQRSVASVPYVYGEPLSGYSLWNSRYVIMPVSSNGWIGVNGGLERLYPPSEVVGDVEQARRWIAQEDWQLTRNRRAHPRAWLVHSVFVRKPVEGWNDPKRLDLMKELVDQSDPVWRDPNRPLLDLRSVAFVETDQPRTLAGYVSRTAVGSDESVNIRHYDPQHVELVSELKRPGLVILADRFDPGWSLTIDGAPAPIFRTNRLMRGAAVKAGRHVLVYTYDPVSFRLGAGMSIAGLLALLALVFWAWESLRTSLKRIRAVRFSRSV
jgi:hypothetical protein